jgi:hypothetical protein
VTDEPPEPPGGPPPEAPTVVIDPGYAGSSAPVDPAYPVAVEPPLEPTLPDVAMTPEQLQSSLLDAAGVPSAPDAPRKKRARTEPVSRDDGDDGDDRDDRDDHVAKPRRRHAVLWAALIAAAITLGVLIFLGKLNANRYELACSPDDITPEQGRSFPPWGSHALGGAEWKAIAIPANAECQPRETDDADELAGWYLDALVDRANAELGTRDPARVEIAAGELDQALLLARAPGRRDQRKDIERLQGDVEYWRASAKLTAARAALLDAAKQFDAAAAKRPRHVADAAAWSGFVKKLVDELAAGPNGQPVLPTVAAAPGGSGDDGAARTPAPPGVLLPSEGSAASAPIAPPDAGVSGGGVLL